MPKQPKSKDEKPQSEERFLIEGKGAIPVYADGEMRRVQRGKPVVLSKDERSYLRRSGASFHKENDE